MPSIEIRQATSGDINTLIQFNHTCETTHIWQMEAGSDEGLIETRFRDTKLPRAMRLDYPRNPASLAEKWTQFDLFLVARIGNQLHGYLNLKLENGSGRVIDLVVNEPSRRQGIATALLISTQDWLRTHGFNQIRLATPIKNHAAIKLAEKMDYTFCGFIDRYYPNHDIAAFFSANWQ
jgi:ribosomal protein S18 acetylase RimI-like enzyme